MTEEAYSNCGRMSVLYAVDFRSWLCTSMLLLECQGFDLPFL